MFHFVFLIPGEAKGMEFKSVILLDFFAELPSTLQKPWRDLLLLRYSEDGGFHQEFPLIEVHLKLLYTAVTRCIEQLFFVETTSSLSGDAAVRWLTTTSISTDTSLDQKSLATINKNVDDIEGMTMTNDEFCIVGIDNAELAETSTELPLDTMLNYLERSIYCFQKAQRPELVTKAKVHANSLKLKDRLLHARDLTDNMETIETEVSQTISSLLRENLVPESSDLLNAITPLVSIYKRQKLQEYVRCPIDILNT